MIVEEKRNTNVIAASSCNILHFVYHFNAVTADFCSVVAYLIGLFIVVVYLCVSSHRGQKTSHYLTSRKSPSPVQTAVTHAKLANACPAETWGTEASFVLVHIYIYAQG